MRKTIIRFTAFVSSLAVVLLSTPIAWAQNSPKPPPIPGLPGLGQETVEGVVAQVITNILLPIAGIIAVLFIIIGGFRYITSGGNDEQAEAGRKTLTNGIIGLVIIILSYVIISVVFNTLYRGIN